MKLPKSRLARAILAILVVCFLGFAYLVWQEMQPEEFFESDVDRAASFLSYQMQDDPLAEQMYAAAQSEELCQ